nr:hypothetical protein [Candidatus Sigynarchaeota archaeon]
MDPCELIELTSDDLDEVWGIFDLVKMNLTDLLVKGVDSAPIDSHLPILNGLKSRLAAMSMTLIADLIQNLIEALQEYKGNARDPECKTRISAIMLKIMTAARLFESEMNLETVKRQLVERMEGSLCKSN